MSELRQTSDVDETADEYGRAEDCFVDFRAAPFHPSLLLARMQPSARAAKDPVIIPQAGLRSAKLPHTSIQPDVLDYPQAAMGALLGYRQTCAIAPLQHPVSMLHRLMLPLDDIDVGSDPFSDMEAYREALSKWYNPDLGSIWLPIVSIDRRSEEGLHFSELCEKKRGLLVRELERESVHVSNSQQKLCEGPMLCRRCLDARHPQMIAAQASSVVNRCVQDTTTDSSQPHCFRPQSITPPLSPISDFDDPFVPGKEVCVIDLTSDPNSPTSLSETRRRFEHWDDPPEKTEASQALLHQPQPEDSMPFSNCGRNTGDLKFEIPLLLDGSDEVFPAKLVSSCTETPPCHSAQEVGNVETLLDEGLEDFLDGSMAQARHIVQNESLDTMGCLLRLPVKIMDLAIPDAAWKQHLSSEMHQYKFLRSSMQQLFDLPLVHSRALDDGSLRWNPVPKTAVGFNSKEVLWPGKASVERLLVNDVPQSSKRLECLPSHDILICFELSPREKQDLDPARCDFGKGRIPYIESRFWTSSSDSEQLQKDCSRGTSTTPPAVESSAQTIVRHRDEHAHRTMGTVAHEAAKRKRKKCEPLGALSTNKTPEETGNLLDAFLQLRGQKRVCGRGHHGLKTRSLLDENSQIESSPQIEQMSEQIETSHLSVPAVTPEIHLPDQKACFITSLKLGRSVSGYLDSQWSRELLIDRDYDCQRQFVWSAVPEGPQNAWPALCYEADVALLPDTGLVVTNIAAVAASATQGNQMSISLRQQVEMVCAKYDVVMVLVSENSTAGECTKPMSSSDLAAFSDFAQFTTTLAGNCSCTFVPGGSETLTKWILAFMCSYTSRALPFRELLCAEETPWELFFRRAGMNVLAAQVLAGRLRKFGQEGLSTFLIMSTQEKITAFGSLVGKRALIKVSQALDRKWS